MQQAWASEWCYHATKPDREAHGNQHRKHHEHLQIQKFTRLHSGNHHSQVIAQRMGEVS